MEVTFYRPKAIQVGWPPRDEDREPVTADMPCVPAPGDEVHLERETWIVEEREWRIADGHATAAVTLR